MSEKVQFKILSLMPHEYTFPRTRKVRFSCYHIRIYLRTNEKSESKEIRNILKFLMEKCLKAYKMQSDEIKKCRKRFERDLSRKMWKKAEFFVI